MQMKDSFYSFIQAIIFTKDILRVEKLWPMTCQTPETGSSQHKGLTPQRWPKSWTQVQIQVEIKRNLGSLNAGVDTQKEVQQLTSQPP